MASPADFVKAADAVLTLKASNGYVPLYSLTVRATYHIVRLDFGGFLPSIDGVTLTDTITKLLQKGKIADVPFIGGYVTDEAGALTRKDITAVDASVIGQWNLSATNLEKAIKLYPVNSSFGSASGTGNFQLSIFDSVVRANAGFGESGITCSVCFVVPFPF
jgi:hypothetical protein